MSFGEHSFHVIGWMRGTLRRAPTMCRDEVRSSGTGSLAKKEVLRMAAYVLVGGGWLGGWCWQRVVRGLRDEAHDAYPVTLTGLGERVHLASPEVDLDTHITDVVNLIEFEDLRDVVLLGHSYAGLVVTGVADRVPDRISQLVYLDTGPLPNGTALIETFPSEARRHIERQVEESGGGWRFPVPPREELATFGSALEGLDDAQLELLRSRAVDQPFGTFTRPLRLENPAREALSKVGILCSFSLEEVQAIIASGNPVFRELASPNWRFVELPTGHYPMFSRPDDLAAVRLNLPSNASTQEDGECST
jgi:pimeloyl-ACP methyl ester carboxylesterase